MAEKLIGKFAKVLCTFPVKVGDRIWVSIPGTQIRAEVTDIADSERGGTEIFWKEI
jgi:hypothetical protein